MYSVYIKVRGEKLFLNSVLINGKLQVFPEAWTTDFDLALKFQNPEFIHWVLAPEYSEYFVISV